VPSKNKNNYGFSERLDREGDYTSYTNERDKTIALKVFRNENAFSK